MKCVTGMLLISSCGRTNARESLSNPLSGNHCKAKTKTLFFFFFFPLLIYECHNYTLKKLSAEMFNIFEPFCSFLILFLYIYTNSKRVAEVQRTR